MARTHVVTTTERCGATAAARATTRKETRSARQTSGQHGHAIHRAGQDITIATRTQDYAKSRTEQPAA